MAAIITVSGVSKRYVIGHQQGNGDGLRHRMEEAMRAPWRWLRQKQAAKRASREEFWALRDLNFEVQQGDAVGIIGRNGAGKSTLLKILSRITEPTEGRIHLRGRVASLLEVGTGFHQELTGRENIFLNGAILGMSKAEISRKFDEIVAFSEIEKFLDTPVKRYSSGMYVRLAFAVAAHLEPEILIVDEVLAVGDSEFQKKCLGKMHDIGRGGRTVLFVSHNMGAIRALCTKGVLLQKGRVKMVGAIEEVTDAYAQTGPEASHTIALTEVPENVTCWVTSASVLCNDRPGSDSQMGDQLKLEVKFRSKEPVAKPLLGYRIRSSQGENVIIGNNHFLPSPTFEPPVTSGTIVCALGQVPLNAGSYSVSLWLGHSPYALQYVEDIISFKVEEKDIWGTGEVPPRGLSPMWWPSTFEFLPGADEADCMTSQSLPEVTA